MIRNDPHFSSASVWTVNAKLPPIGMHSLALSASSDIDLGPCDPAET